MNKFVSLMVLTAFLVVAQGIAAHAEIKTVFEPRGDDSYTFYFENKEGLLYRLPFISNEGNAFKYGDDNDDFVMIEGVIEINASTGANHLFNIGRFDYLVLTDSVSGNSHIVRYDGIDSVNKQLSFTEVAFGGGGTRNFVYTEQTTIPGVLGVADVVFGGVTYKAYIARLSRPDTGEEPLAIDMNADDRVNREQIPILTKTGEEYSFELADRSDGGTWSPNTSTWNNAGDLLFVSQVSAKLLVRQDLFGAGKPLQDESVEFQVAAEPNATIDIPLVTGSTFNLSGTSSYTTYYGELFELTQPDPRDPTTVRVVSPGDQVPPEASFNYDPVSEQLVVNGVDNSGEILPITVSVTQLWNGYALHEYHIADLSGNDLTVDMIVFQEGDRLEFNILSLQYNDDPAVQLATNVFVAEKRQNTTRGGILSQRYALFPQYEVRATYSKSSNATKVAVFTPSGNSATSASGVQLLQIVTDQGAIRYQTVS